MQYLYPVQDSKEIRSLALSDAQEEQKEDHSNNIVRTTKQIQEDAEAHVLSFDQGHRDLTDNIDMFRQIYVEEYVKAYRSFQQ